MATRGIWETGAWARRISRSAPARDALTKARARARPAEARLDKQKKLLLAEAEEAQKRVLQQRPAAAGPGAGDSHLLETSFDERFRVIEKDHMFSGGDHQLAHGGAFSIDDFAQSILRSSKAERGGTTDAENIQYARVSQYTAAEVAKVEAKAIEKGKKEGLLVGARALKVIGTMTNAQIAAQLGGVVTETEVADIQID
jgi:hypothetical protein